ASAADHTVRARSLDQALLRLEGCPEFPKGFIRALRADALQECADALAGPVLATPDLDADTRSTLAGLAAAARIDRWRPRVARFAGPQTVAGIRTFAVQTVQSDVERLLQEIVGLEAQLGALPARSYGRARALVAISGAWMRASNAFRAGD